MYHLDEQRPHFPPVQLANEEGLLAIHGNLEVDTLVQAYRQGIFPWFEEGSPILWWSPDPRLVLHPASFHLSRSTQKFVRHNPWTITINYAFQQVIAACSRSTRSKCNQAQVQTWITDSMRDAYIAMHYKGLAHSFEVWHETRLVGGLYGVAIGRIFFGESMFSHVSNASKVALFHLTQHLHRHAFPLIDCQVKTQHLMSLGAELMPREQFIQIIDKHCATPGDESIWQPYVLACPGKTRQTSNS